MNSNSVDGRLIFVYLLLAVLLFKLAVVWLEFLQFRANLTNPLMPRVLIDMRRNLSVFLSLIYLPAIAFGLVYAVKRIFFIPIVISMGAVLVLTAIFYLRIHEYFMTT